MRKLLTTAAMILTMGVAAPAFADGYNGHQAAAPSQQQTQFDRDGKFDRDGQYDRDGKFGEPKFDRDARFGRDVNAWERNWSPLRVQLGFHNALTRARLTARLQAQGFYRIYDLKPGRYGNWRALAMYRGHLVALRVDQFSGRVLAAHYV